MKCFLQVFTVIFIIICPRIEWFVKKYYKNLRATFYDINLDRKEKESKKSENLDYDLESCKPM